MLTYAAKINDMPQLQTQEMKALKIDRLIDMCFMCFLSFYL
jgi:hypothetical protein